MRQLHIFPLIVFLLLVGWVPPLKGQNITTFAGDGTAGYSGDGGSVTAARIGDPYAITVNRNGNIFFTDVLNNRVRKVTAAGIISTVAGAAAAGYNGDAIAATTAQLNDPTGVAADTADNVFIVDKLNNRVRMVSAITGVITTIAGNGTAGFAGDGKPATASMLNAPEDICFDRKGNLYILDNGNFRIRKIDSAGIMRTVAGSGTNGFGGDDGPATAANIQDMAGICTDAAGNIYFSQGTAKRVRKISIASGKINTIAGNGFNGPGGDGGSAIQAALDPERLVVDKAGNIYVSGRTNNNIRRISTTGIIQTVAGHLTAGFSGDAGLAILAELNSPAGVALDSCDNLYIVDQVNNRIRKVAFDPLCVHLGVDVTAPVIVRLYPSPADATVNVDNLPAAAAYQLLDLEGRVQQEGVLHKGNNEVGINALPSGLYLLSITDPVTGLRLINKVVKR